MRLLKLPLNKCCFIFILLASLPFTGGAVEKIKPVENYKLKLLSNPKPAPDFILLDMDGESHSLKHYRGKVVLINFWASWCSPCLREMPSLQKLYEDLGTTSFVVLAINQWEDDERAFEFMGQLNPAPTFPILFDKDSKISDRYGVQGLPSSYIVDKQGRIVYRAKGGRDFDHPQIVSKIKALF